MISFLNTLETLISNSPLLLVISVASVLSLGFLYAYSGKSNPSIFLNGETQYIVLTDKVHLTNNTLRLRFSFSDQLRRFGLPAGQHVKIYCPNVVGSIEGEWNKKPDHELYHAEICRKYTPVTPESEARGYVDFVVKVYTPDPTTFPDGGKVSQYLGSLKIGEQAKIQGPVGRTLYHGMGRFSFKGRELTPKKYIGMVAGGTGITPMLQVLHKTFLNPKDDTKFWLVYANRTTSEIIERDFLEELSTAYPEQFHLWYTVDSIEPSEKETWKYSVGYVTEKMLKEHLPSPSLESLILLCGPPPMTHQVCYPALEQLGWSTEDIVNF